MSFIGKNGLESPHSICQNKCQRNKDLNVGNETTKKGKENKREYCSNLSRKAWAETQIKGK